MAKQLYTPEELIPLVKDSYARKRLREETKHSAGQRKYKDVSQLISSSHIWSQSKEGRNFWSLLFDVYRGVRPTLVKRIVAFIKGLF